MKYHHRNHEGKCRNPTSNSELHLVAVGKLPAYLLSSSQLYDRLAHHPFEKRLVVAIAASRAYCGAERTVNFCA